MAAPVGLPRILLFCLTGALLSSLSTQGATDPLASVLSHEERGELAAALTELRASADVLKANKEHEAALVALLHTFDVVEAGLAKQQNAEAQAALEALLPRLDPLRDAVLLRSAHKKLVDLRAEVSRKAEADLKEADRLVSQGRHAEAIAINKDIAESNAQEIPVALSRPARQGKDRAEGSQSQAEAVGIWGKIWKSVSEGFVTLAGWNVFLLTGFLLLWSAGAWRKRRPPREETVIILEDLTAQAPEREVMSRGL